MILKGIIFHLLGKFFPFCEHVLNSVTHECTVLAVIDSILANYEYFFIGGMCLTVDSNRVLRFPSANQYFGHITGSMVMGI